MKKTATLNIFLICLFSIIILIYLFNNINLLDLLTVILVFFAWVLCRKDSLTYFFSPVFIFIFLYTFFIYLGILISYLGVAAEYEVFYCLPLWEASTGLIAFSLGAFFADYLLRIKKGYKIFPSKLSFCQKFHRSSFFLYYFLIYFILTFLLSISIIFQRGLPSIGNVYGRIVYLIKLGYYQYVTVKLLPMLGLIVIGYAILRKNNKLILLSYLMLSLPLILLRVPREFAFYTYATIMIIILLGFKDLTLSFNLKKIAVIFLVIIIVSYLTLVLRAFAYGHVIHLYDINIILKQFFNRILMAEASAFSYLVNTYPHYQPDDLIDFFLSLMPFMRHNNPQFLHDIFIATRKIGPEFRDLGTLPPTIPGDLFRLGGFSLMVIGLFGYGIFLKMVEYKIFLKQYYTLPDTVIQCLISLILARGCLTGIAITSREVFRVTIMWFLFVWLPFKVLSNCRSKIRLVNQTI